VALYAYAVVSTSALYSLTIVLVPYKLASRQIGGIAKEGIVIVSGSRKYQAWRDV